MRYQNEIEEILKISEELGSTLLTKYYILQAIMGWEFGKTMILHHLVTNLHI